LLGKFERVQAHRLHVAVGWGGERVVDDRLSGDHDRDKLALVGYRLQVSHDRDDHPPFALPIFGTGIRTELLQYRGVGVASGLPGEAVADAANSLHKVVWAGGAELCPQAGNVAYLQRSGSLFG